MSLRITQGMIYSQSLRDIRNSLFGSTVLQQQISSGLRVNRPSDDPAAAMRILPLNTDLRQLDQMLDNSQLAQETLNLGTASLEDASSMVQRVRELVVQAANSTLSDGDRSSISEEINQVLEQMVSVANVKRGDRYLFGGTVTDRPPFQLVNGPNGSRVAYTGNLESLSVAVAPGVDTALNIPGSEIFMQKTRLPSSFTGGSGAQLGTGNFSGSGADTLSVSFAGLSIPGGTTGIAQGSGNTTALGDLDYTFTASPPSLSINGGPSVAVAGGVQEIPVGTQGAVVSLDLTLPINPASGTITSNANLSIDGGASSSLVDFSSAQVQVTNGSNGNEVSVDVNNLFITGDEEVVYGGVFDLFETMVHIRDLMQNPTGKSPGAISNALSKSLDKLDLGHESVLDGLRSLGFRNQNMNLLQNRVEGLKVNTQESLSLAQDTDMVSAIVEYNEQNNLYQAALQVGAQVVQTSLLNFLR